MPANACLKFSTYIFAGLVALVSCASPVVARADDAIAERYSALAYGTFDFNRALFVQAMTCSREAEAIIATDAAVSRSVQALASDGLRAIDAVRLAPYEYRGTTRHQLADNDEFCRNQYPQLAASLRELGSQVNMQSWHARPWIYRELGPASTTVFSDLGADLCECSFWCIGGRKAADLLSDLKAKLEEVRRKEQQIETSGFHMETAKKYRIMGTTLE